MFPLSCLLSDSTELQTVICWSASATAASRFVELSEEVVALRVSLEERNFAINSNTSQEISSRLVVFNRRGAASPHRFGAF